MSQNTPASANHLLIVDDDHEICTLLNRFLSKRGFRVSTATDSVEMQEQLQSWKIDLIVLDRMLLGEDGLKICETVRKTSRVPIVMLTVLGEETDRIIGFKAGADDYLTKPFNPYELMARIKAVLRRTHMVPPSMGDSATRTLTFGHWRLDVGLRQLTTKQGALVDLSATEFDLLVAFVEHAGQVLSRDQLLDLASGQVEIPFDRKIDMQVSRLRRKIEDDPKKPVFIRTVRGGGYMFTAKASPDEKPIS